MNKPSNETIEQIAPSIVIDELPISDGYSIRNVAHAEQRDTLRLPRGGNHEATLVACKKFYDGSSGGEAGHYALVFIEFRAAGSRWRTAGVKIRAEEAKRLSRDLMKCKASKPARGEGKRVGGKELATTESELLGAPTKTKDGGLYTIFVRHRMRNEEWGRTRGVTLIDNGEVPTLANFLASLAGLQ